MKKIKSIDQFETGKTIVVDTNLNNEYLCLGVTNDGRYIICAGGGFLHISNYRIDETPDHFKIKTGTEKSKCDECGEVNQLTKH